MPPTLGSPHSFAIVVATDPSGPIHPVEVWACGQNLSQEDSSAYLPQFIASMAATERRLKTTLNFLQHEHLFLSLGVEEAFALLESHQDLSAARADLLVFDFGPTTDSHLCFLLPLRGKLFLACRRHGDASGRVWGVEVLPYDLIATLERAGQALGACQIQAAGNE